MNADKFMDEYGGRAVANLRRQNGNHNSLFGTMLAECEVAEKSHLTDRSIRFEAGNLIVAGSDTTAVTLTYLIWAVLRRPSLQRRLEEEVAALDEQFDDSQLEKLELLNGIIDETLRLYGAAPGSLPRTVPKGGATLAGHFIPGGTVVETQAYTLHRDANVFPNPMEFDETRFMGPSKLTKTQKQAFSPFGAGTRICIGLHLARTELRLATALFFRECRGARLSQRMTEDMMEMENFFLIAPVGHCCEVTLQADKAL